MSDARRWSSLSGLPSDQASVEKTWPTNLALVGLGGVILWLAFRFLRWDDPRLLFSPWTYALATPLWLLGLSLVLRRMVSRLVQSSAQVAFLVSVIVHLLLLVSALDVVIATRMWPGFFETLAAEKQAMLGQQRLKLSGNFAAGVRGQKNEARPDYLRYVPTEHVAQAATLSAQKRLELARSEQAKLVSPEPQLALADPKIVIRQPMPATDLLSTSRLANKAVADEADRTEFASPSPSLSRPSQIEAFRATTQPPELVAVDSEADHRRASDRAHWLPSQVALDPKLTDSILVEPVLGEPAGLSRAQGQSIESPNLDNSPTRSVLQPKQLQAEATLQFQSTPGRVVVPENSRSVTPAQPALQPTLAPQKRISPAAQTTIDQLEKAVPSLLAIEPLAGLAESLPRPMQAYSETPQGKSLDDVAQQAVAVPDTARDFLPQVAESEGGRIAVPMVDTPANITNSSRLTLMPQDLPRERRSQIDESDVPLRLNVEPELRPDLGAANLGQPSSAGGLPVRSALAMPAITVPSLEPSRFGLDVVGGPLGSGSHQPLPAPAFQQRVDRLADGLASSTGSDGPQTERAIELGLAFLAKHQRSDGSWRLQDLDREVLLRSDTAATGLCLLAFQGAGYTHKQYKYADANARGLQFLIEHQLPNGDLYIRQDPASDQNAWLYSHAIATLAICEAYGMTQDEVLRRPAQMAVDFMVDSQEPTRGGWRYRPSVGSDTSVTGWFTMALKSAQLAGLEVPQLTFDRIRKYLQASQASETQPHLFRYNPYAPDTVEQRHGLKPTHVMTSVGLLMRMYLGWQRELPEMQAGADFLLKHLPESNSLLAAQRDTYYWYYATQVLFHMGGSRWQVWNDRLRPVLLDSQIAGGVMAGSWDPYLPSADLWARYGGRLYVTTMNLLSLEVNYRHLPLYEATAR